MGTTAEKLQYTLSAVDDIQSAINEKGVPVDDTIELSEYGNKIREISGGQPIPTIGEIEVRFLYLDPITGEDIIESHYYNKGENAVFPIGVGNVQANTWNGEKGNPALTFQEWNYPQELLNNLQQNIDVGATYVPTDGKSHLYITITKTTGADEVDALTQTLYFYKNNNTATLTIDWGDGVQSTSTTSDNQNISHTYQNYGNYDVTVWISNGSGTYRFGNSSSSTTVFGGEIQSKRNILTKCFIGNNSISIGSSAFGACYSLTKITIPTSVTIINASAFINCYSLTNITIPASVTTISSSAFQYCYSLVNITIPASVKSISASLFLYCYSLTYMTIPASVTSIGSSAFQSCYSLTNITIPTSVTTIGSSAFLNCFSLTNITIPTSVTSFGTTVFGACYSLTNITIPASVTSISGSMFQYCYSLTNITIPASVTSIGTALFQYCYSLTKYIFKPTIPPTLSSTNTFSSTNTTMKIYVPDESVDAYKTATNWVTYANYIYPMSEMPEE